MFRIFREARDIHKEVQLKQLEMKTVHLNLKKEVTSNISSGRESHRESREDFRCLSNRYKLK